MLAANRLRHHQGHFPRAKPRCRHPHRLPTPLERRLRHRRRRHPCLLGNLLQHLRSRLGRLCCHHRRHHRRSVHHRRRPQAHRQAHPLPQPSHLHLRPRLCHQIHSRCFHRPSPPRPTATTPPPSARACSRLPSARPPACGTLATPSATDPTTTPWPTATPTRPHRSSSRS